MRFLFLNQFYPPDPAPTGRYLHDVARELVQRGHGVRVLCSRKAYGTGADMGGGAAEREGVTVERVRGTPLNPASLAGRAADHLGYFVQAFARSVLRAERPHLVCTATTPPFLGLIGALLTRWRGIAHVEWTMDVYPDVLHAHGMDETGPVGRLFDAVAAFQLRRAALVLTLGTHMSRRMARLLAGVRVETVALWSDPVMDGPVGDGGWRARRGWREGEVVLLYSGNMGRGHRFGEFLAVAHRLGADGPIWAFAGGGPRRAEIERFREEHPTARVQLLPAVAPEEVAGSLLSGDVHLVSLSASWQGLIVPSKLAAAFALGRPVIFVGAAENEIAASITESGGGWVVPEGDLDALTRAVTEARDPEERRRRGEAGRRYALGNFDHRRNVVRIADLLEECAARR